MTKFFSEKQITANPYIGVSTGYQATYKPVSTIIQNGNVVDKKIENQKWMTSTTINTGVNFKKDNYILNIEGGIGTAVSGKISVSNKLDLTDALAFEFKAGAEATQSLVTKNIKYETNTKYTMPDDIENNIKQTTNINFNNNSKKIAFGVGLSHQGERHKISLGIEEGWNTGSFYQVSHNTQVNINEENHTNETRFELKEQGFYVTPTLNLEIDNKKGNASLVANIDKYSGDIGIRYKF